MKKVLLIFFFFGLILESCYSPKNKQKELGGELMHTVLIWLNSEEDVESLKTDSKQFLNEIDEVKTYFIGTPAMTPRNIVDNSYSIFITMTFENKEDLKTFAIHPAHVSFLEKNKSKWDKILVYDALEN